MKTATRTLILAALLAVSLNASEAGGIFPFDYKRVELDNGFKAYLIKAGAPGQIAYVTVVRTGSRDEWEPGRSGFAHFFEHMMFRGTEKYPLFDQVLTRIGADNNAFTTLDRTTYYIIASSDNLKLLVDLESDRFQNLKYTESVYRTEAGAVLGEYSLGRSNPFSFLNEKIGEIAFDEHTYKHTVIGFEKDIRAMPAGYDYALSFFQRYYRPENCVLLLVGDFDSARAEELIRQRYGPWKSGYVEPRIQAEPAQKGPRSDSAEFQGRTLPILSVHYKAPAWDPADKMGAALTALGQIAFGSNSEIYRKLVLREQKVQSLFESFDLQRDPHLVSVYALVTDGKELNGVAEEIRKTVELFQQKTCDPKKLENTKRALRYGFLMGLETAQNVALAIAGAVANSGGIEALDEYYRTLDEVTPEDLQSAARRYLIEDSRTTITLLPATGGNR